VEVQDVEAFLGDDRRDPVGEVKAQRDTRNRIVDGDCDRRADAVEPRAVEVNVGAT